MTKENKKTFFDKIDSIKGLEFYFKEDEISIWIKRLYISSFEKNSFR